MTARWDIFCKVVDNFGDAGVAWRLARQLAHEHSLAVCLWIDELRPLARFVPGVDAGCDPQRVDGIEIRQWRSPFAEVASADVVVEAFGCGLPDGYTAAMARASPPPVWVVLEYLSAETWIDSAHGLPSPHPRLALTRRFWFPGFTSAAGGLQREAGLIEARDAFRRDPKAREHLWETLALPVPAPGECRVSFYCYPGPAVPALFDAWADGDERVSCLVPDGVAAGAIDAWTAGNVPHPGRPVSRGQLTLHSVPFVTQEVFDRLLWSCDVNFVRGEDSFVRAQWAARPFVWHIYPQAENAHLAKLDAFVDRYVDALGPSEAAAVRRMFKAWNGATANDDIDGAWRAFAAARPALLRHGKIWSDQLTALPELATGLVRAASDRL
ncbi:MAG: elongation factor P maturation arginine rhamnosyltransferase EarP [Casimicrobiaceae bacterium]